MEVNLFGFNIKRIEDCLEAIEKIGSNIGSVLEYQRPNVAEKVVRIIFSYCDYVNENIWRKKI